MGKKLIETKFDHLIFDILYRSNPHQYNYHFFPWPLWPENLLQPQPNDIFEPKFPHKTSADFLTALRFIDCEPPYLHVLEQGVSVQENPVTIFQSATKPNHILRADFSRGIKIDYTDIIYAHTVLAFILGTQPKEKYLSQIA